MTLDTAIAYDMKHRSFRKIAKLPDSIQSPAICTHEKEVYAAGHKNIFKYEDEIGDIDRWTTVISTEMRTNRMTSFKDYIYCAQNYFSPMYRFKPGVDQKLELITNYSHPAAAICNLSKLLNTINTYQSACTNSKPISTPALLTLSCFYKLSCFL